MPNWEQMMTKEQNNDHSGQIAIALMMANLLFVVFFGIPYILLCIFYLWRAPKASELVRSHMKQALIAATLTTVIYHAITIIFDISVINLATGGHGEIPMQSIIALEAYFILVVPLFMGLGRFSRNRAIRGEAFRYPLIGRFVA